MSPATAWPLGKSKLNQALGLGGKRLECNITLEIHSRLLGFPYSYMEYSMTFGVRKLYILILVSIPLTWF